MNVFILLLFYSKTLKLAPSRSKKCLQMRPLGGIVGFSPRLFEIRTHTELLRGTIQNHGITGTISTRNERNSKLS